MLNPELLSEYGLVEACFPVGDHFVVEITTGYDDNAQATADLLALINKHVYKVYPNVAILVTRKDYFFLKLAQ